MAENKFIRDELFPTCPIRNVLARLGDKWSLLVLYTLNHASFLSKGPQLKEQETREVSTGGESIRFKELQRSIPDISQKSLTMTLRMLEEDGFVHREVYPEVPPRVEYSLTARGKDFLPLVDNMISWAKTNMDAIISDRQHNNKM